MFELVGGVHHAVDSSAMNCLQLAFDILCLLSSKPHQNQHIEAKLVDSME
jgi:hypothetical protein